MVGGRHVRALCAAGGIALAAAGCSRNPATGESWPRLISTSEEIAIGRQAAPRFEEEFGGKLADETVQQYVRYVGSRLAGACERKDIPYQYAVLASDDPNAFALPGGKVYITVGLMARMCNESELAAAMAHETGHVAAGHNVQAMQRQLGGKVLGELAAAAMGSAAGAVAQAAADGAAAVVGLRYSRGDEFQADRLAIRYMCRAGYNPYGLVDLLETLRREDRKEPGKLAQLFESHPAISERIKEARKEIQRKYPCASPQASDPRTARFLQMRSRALLCPVP